MFHLSMDCFWGEIIKGDLILKEAEDARWLTMDQIYDVKWLPTDIILIDLIKKQMSKEIKGGGENESVLK